MDKLLQFYQKYEHLKSVLFFFFGFLFDLLTLDYVDDLFGLIFQGLYFCISLVIFHFEVIDKKLPYADHLKVEIFHFCTGALLSAYTIFFFKSSSISNSFIFLFFISLLLIVNEIEFFKKQKLFLKALLISLTGFFLLISIYPLILKTVSSIVFYSAIISLSLFCLLQVKLYLKLDVQEDVVKKSILRPQLFTIGFLTVFYLFKIIPPIPLVLNYSGIFHLIEKKDSKYYLYHEKPWWAIWNEADENFTARSGDKIFLFTEIYSPAQIKTTVYANFQIYGKDGWLDADKIPLKITGGRRKGYRGYSYKSNYGTGDWRVIITTKDDREIGRHYFEVNKIEEEPLKKDQYKVIIK